MRTSLVAIALGSAVLALGSNAHAQQAPAGQDGDRGEPRAHGKRDALELTTLRDLHERGVISQAELDAAIKDMGDSTGDHAVEGPSLVFGKWATTFYGFVEGDTIYDSTQSFSDLAGNAQVARPNGNAPPPPASQQTYAGSNGQTTFSVRNSRFGMRLKPPGSESVRSSGVLEFDFLGTQTVGYGAGQVSESAYFTSPLLRIRHAYFRVETPIVDVLAGQTWQLFGWQGDYQPNTVEIQGLPGQLYARTPQVRISKSFHGPVGVDLAVAAARPPSRASNFPELEGGVKVALESWKGLVTHGATGTAVQPASIALTADYRQFAVPGIDSLIPSDTVSTQSLSLAADAFIPIIPATRTKRDNALSFVGEVVYGGGIADMYTGLNGGVQFPFIPNINATDPQNLNPTPTWPQNIDNGLVDYDLATNNQTLNGGQPGSPTGAGQQGFVLHPVAWASWLLGLQYTLPGVDGKVWLSANYSHMQSRNGSLLGFNYWSTADFARVGNTGSLFYYYNTSEGQVRRREDWWDANVFYQPLEAVRVGAEFAQFIDRYVDGFTATNNRFQLSGYFLF
jgi:hypothetical protein